MSEKPALEYETAVRDAKDCLDDPETELFVFGAAQRTGTAETMIARDLNGDIPQETYLTMIGAIVARLDDASDMSTGEIGEEVTKRAKGMDLTRDVP